MSRQLFTSILFDLKLIDFIFYGVPSERILNFSFSLETGKYERVALKDLGFLEGNTKLTKAYLNRMHWGIKT